MSLRFSATASALLDEANRFQRYAGLHPYGDHPLDIAFFFGRDEEIEILSQRIRAERSMLLIGRSGLGKSSLLQAGVFPILRARGFFPFVVRFGEVEGAAEQLQTDPVRAISGSLQEVCGRTSGVELAELELAATADAADLTGFFRSVDIWRGERILTPVLVLDQFEEVFHRPLSFRRDLADALGTIIELPALPSAFYQDRSQRKHPLDLRVVFSMREEYLAELEELTGKIPSLFENRFRLLAMGRENARSAIVEPARMDADTLRKRIRKRALCADPATLDQYVERLSRSRQFELSETPRDNAVETLLGVLVDARNEIDLTMLQTICRHLEERVQEAFASGGPICIGNDFIGDTKSLEAVWRHHYHNALDVTLDKQFAVKESSADESSHIERRQGIWPKVRRFILDLLPNSQRSAARNLCERALITEQGKRISMVEENVYKYGVTDDTLTLLQRNRLIRKDIRPPLEGFYYEITHDRLARIVFEESRARFRKTFRLSLALSIVSIAGFYWYWRTAEEGREQNKTLTMEIQHYKNQLETTEQELSLSGAWCFYSQRLTDGGPARANRGELAIQRNTDSGKPGLTLVGRYKSTDFWSTEFEQTGDGLRFDFTFVKSDKTSAVQSADPSGGARHRRLRHGRAEMSTLRKDDSGLPIVLFGHSFVPETVASPTAEVWLVRRDQSPGMADNGAPPKLLNCLSEKELPAPRDEFRDGPSWGPILARIPPGQFRMGSDRGKSWPAHEVTIPRGLAVTMSEIRVDEYERYAGKAFDGRGCTTRKTDGSWTHDPSAGWNAPGFYQGGDHPVVCVSYSDAEAYAEWISEKTGHCYRLPSESEWEYFARAKGEDDFWWGAVANTDRANYAPILLTGREYGTTKVRSFSPNGFALYDTAGNAAEWVKDCWHDDYNQAPNDGSAWTSNGESCQRGVVRGGAWSQSATKLQSAYREALDRSARRANVGMRLVRTEGPCAPEEKPFEGAVDDQIADH